MTFPTIVSHTEYQASGSLTTWTPTTVSCEIGDLIVFIAACSGSRTLTVNGWQSINAQSSLTAQKVFWKNATSRSEVITVTTSPSATGFNGVVFLIRGAQNLSGTVATSSTSNPDPAAHNAGAVRDHLWIVTHSRSANAATAAPTGYTYSKGANTTAPITRGYRFLNAQTEDPSAWTAPTGGSSMITMAIWGDPITATDVRRRRSAYSF